MTEAKTGETSSLDDKKLIIKHKTKETTYRRAVLVGTPQNVRQPDIPKMGTENKKILISTNMKSDYQLLLDFIGDLQIPFKFDENPKKEEEVDPIAFLHSSSIMPKLPSIEFYDVVFIFDSSPSFLQMWINYLNETKLTQRKDVFIISSYRSIYQPPNDKMHLSEYICRRCAFEAFTDIHNTIKDGLQILESAVEFDISQPIKKETR